MHPTTPMPRRPGPPGRAARKARAATMAACWWADNRDLFEMFGESIDDLAEGGTDTDGELMAYGLLRAGNALTHADADTTVTQIYTLAKMLRRASAANLPGMYGRFGQVVCHCTDMFADEHLAGRLELAVIAPYLTTPADSWDLPRHPRRT